MNVNFTKEDLAQIYSMISASVGILEAGIEVARDEEQRKEFQEGLEVCRNLMMKIQPALFDLNLN